MDDEWISIGMIEGRSDEVRVAVEEWLQAHGALEVVLGADDVMVQAMCGRDSAGQWVQECRVLLRREAVETDARFHGP